MTDTVRDVSDALAYGQPSFPCSRKALVLKFKESAKPISGLKFGDRYSKWYSIFSQKKFPLNLQMDRSISTLPGPQNTAQADTPAFSLPPPQARR
ncbi:hypothetical protein [Pseudomonas sp. JY-Q]|uniref:hypothetical protein n=1 Tax=Pseudomonas sp. JY-Q TaxID=1338689 RepID=UPI0012EA5C2E|nr:hypothetical protein [Pseudomonas sp. JY-Q]